MLDHASFVKDWKKKKKGKLCLSPPIIWEELYQKKLFESKSYQVSEELLSSYVEADSIMQGPKWFQQFFTCSVWNPQNVIQEYEEYVIKDQNKCYLIYLMIIQIIDSLVLKFKIVMLNMFNK